MKKLLRAVKRSLDRHGSALDELYWRFRHLGSGRHWAAKCVAPESLAHPHRKLLLDALARHAPFISVLEVGCASGPNLYLIGTRFPGTRLHGTDISGHALRFGRNWLASQGLTARLERAPAWDLRAFPDKSIDIVISDAALIYVGPQRIARTLREMIRVAKKAIILVEWHVGSPSSVYADHWAHNYRELLANVPSVKDVRLSKIPPEVWAGAWEKYGYIIEVQL